MKYISAGSYSRLDIFSQCKFRAKLAFIDKIPEPKRGPGPLTAPDGSAEWHNDRGSRIHDLAENYVNGSSKSLDKSLFKFRDEFDKLRFLYKGDTVLTEQMWCYNNAWKPIKNNDWDNIWMRIKTDATIFLTPKKGVVIDYKTGKKFGNEVKHAQQTQLYALAAFIKYPKLQEIETELWYLDQNELTAIRYTRAEAMRLFNLWNNKNIVMTTTTKFPPNPNAYTCKWCPYGPRRSGNCSVGIQ
ncbi:MAG: hypothetical protein DRQ01_00815 [Ignavibacteriae bacterium]|nr:MAG: hypothetical protein DRQ01_00815 [Ignavibacteriota bacterium]